MAEQLTGIVQSNDTCQDTDGGLLQSYALDLDALDTVTWGSAPDDYAISAITITGAGITMAKFVYTDDETAYFNATGERQTRNKHIFANEAFMKFEGVTNAKISAVQLLLRVCAQFWLHVGLSGTIWVQGIEKDGGASGWKKPRQKAKPRVNNFSGTGGEVERIEVFIENQNKTMMLCDLDTDAIEALAGT